VATVVGAAVAALVGKLTAYLFVAVAIFLFAVASAVLYSRAKTPAAERFRRRFLLGASLTAALLACGTLAYGIPNELTKGVRSDEKLVSSLSAGQDLSRFRAALGPPDTKRPSGAFLVYQFQRSRATLQAVVNRVGEVVSYAVYAKKTSFSPSFDHGLRITLNRTTVDDAFGASSVGANLYCGAHKAGYFEGFGGFNAVEARYFVLGVSDANTTEVSTAGICRAVTGGLAACNFSTGNELSSRMLACVKSAGVGRRLRSTLKANVYIETAPGLRLLPVMLYPPDEAANLGS
jgi:hypothetical protein